MVVFLAAERASLVSRIRLPLLGRSAKRSGVLARPKAAGGGRTFQVVVTE